MQKRANAYKHELQTATNMARQHAAEREEQKACVASSIRVGARPSLSLVVVIWTGAWRRYAATLVPSKQRSLN